ncbi:MAG: mercury resistance system periplasmic binding protein MerP [Steroidobacteraceae bacterium]|jgi:mercuric ion binding protein
MRSFIPLIAMLLAATAVAGPPRTVTLQVQNMTCETCPIVVRKALQRVPGVTSANVDFALKTATVTFDPDQVKPGALTQATTNAGLPSTLKATP